MIKEFNVVAKFHIFFEFEVRVLEGRGLFRSNTSFEQFIILESWESKSNLALEVPGLLKISSEFSFSFIATSENLFSEAEFDTEDKL